MITDIVDIGLSLCQETAERKLEAKVSELQQLQATIMEKDLRLEGAVADAERLKAQMAEKQEQVGWGLHVGHRTRKQSEGRAVVILR